MKIKKDNYFVILLFFIVIALLLKVYFLQKEKNKLSLFLPQETAFAFQLNENTKIKENIFSHLFTKKEKNYSWKNWLNENPHRLEIIDYLSKKFSFTLLPFVIKSPNQLFSLINDKIIVIGLKEEERINLAFISSPSFKNRNLFLKRVKHFPQEKVPISLDVHLYKVFIPQTSSFFYYTFLKNKIIFASQIKTIEKIVLIQNKGYQNRIINQGGEIERFDENKPVNLKQNTFLNGFIKTEKIELPFTFIKRKKALKDVINEKKIYFFGELLPEKKEISLNFYTPQNNLLFQNKKEKTFIKSQNEIFQQLSLGNSYVFALEENNLKNKINYFQKKIKEILPEGLTLEKTKIEEIEKKYQINFDKEILPFLNQGLYLIITPKDKSFNFKNSSLKQFFQNNEFALVIQINKEENSSSLEKIEKILARILAYQFPSLQKKILPDQTEIKEIIAEPEKFQAKPLKSNKLLKYIQTPLFTLYLSQKKDRLILANSLDYLKKISNCPIEKSYINKEYIVFSFPHSQISPFKKIFLFNYWLKQGFFTKIIFQ